MVFVTRTVFCLVALLDACSAISCRNANGDPVEWSIIYKLPKDKNEKGGDFGYIDSSMLQQGIKTFEPSSGSIFDEEANPLAVSLRELIHTKKQTVDQETTYVVYNDQPPKMKASPHESSGHTKGLLAFREGSGLWIVHSVPHFPEKLFTDEYTFPATAHTYGQTILCMSLESNGLDTIGAHLRRQKPTIYFANAPQKIRQRYEQIDRLLAKNFTWEELAILKDGLIGVNGTNFLAFAKGGAIHEDVYSSAIAPSLGTDLLVETWLNGNGDPLPSNCSERFNVMNVEQMKIVFGKTTHLWHSSHDHSKWAVSTEKPWLCIGSINRMRSQFIRGGETVCMLNQALHDIFSNGVADHSKCGV